jgi:hypothetical protein
LPARRALLGAGRAKALRFSRICGWWKPLRPGPCASANREEARFLVVRRTQTGPSEAKPF